MLRDWFRASGLTIGHIGAAARSCPPYVFLDQRWGHHGAHSGYLISNGVGPTLSRDDRLLPYPVRRFLSRRKADSSWEPRMLAHLMLLVGKTKVLHIVDGDFDTWVYRRRPNWLKTKITATFHQTEDRLREIVKTLEVGMLDGIICVSRVQIPVVQHLVPPGRCVFIPHGVDMDFFAERPAPESHGGPLLLAVGVHRRDFETLIAAAQIIKSRRPDTLIRLIGPREHLAKLARDDAVQVISNVSDVELRAAYHSATMLFLPLEATTANNALLESMATGRPAVITDLPAIHDYTGTDAALFCRAGDAQAHADAAFKLLDDADLCERMGHAAAERAIEFNWPNVRKSVLGFLQNVAVQQ